MLIPPQHLRYVKFGIKLWIILLIRCYKKVSLKFKNTKDSTLENITKKFQVYQILLITKICANFWGF